MKSYLFLASKCVFCAVMAVVTYLPPVHVQGQLPGVKTEGLGIMSLGSWSGPGQISRADSEYLKGVSLVRRWHELEPSDDDFRFHEEFGVLIEKAHQENFYVKLLIYVGDQSPEWLYDLVPTVNTNHENFSRFPYYLDQEGIYKEEFFEMIDEFGAFIGGLTPELQDRIHFVFAVEGVTADGAPYKGDLQEDSMDYAITAEEWAAFRQETWGRYRDALPIGMPIMINIDSNTDEQNAWIVENMYVVGLKYGMFSHGYHVSDAVQRLAQFRAIELATYAAGKELITEGEEDREIYTLPRGTMNIGQAIYWGGLYSTHNPIYLWTVPREFLKPAPNTVFEHLESPQEIFKLFNRYAGVQRPELSPRAFVALRDGLNAADTIRFPEGRFSAAVRNNIGRYEAIAEEFASHGAVLQDPNNAKLGPFQNRRRAGYNDVGWEILPGNYSRFITQIQPGSGDVGWWHVDVIKKGTRFEDASHYGRFARGFEDSSDKNAMFFDIDDDLAGMLPVDRSAVRLKIVYFDEVEGSTWQLQYDTGNGVSTVDVTNRGSGEWKTVSIQLRDANFQNGLEHGADIALVNTDSQDDIFHMIDLEYGPSDGVGKFVVNEDIGDVGSVGSTSYSSDNYTVSGSGEDIWGTSDEFHYAYNPQFGDGQQSAKIESVKWTHKWAKAGVMVRNSRDAGARNVAVLVRPNGKVLMQWRVGDSGITYSKSTHAAKKTGFPKWVKIVRSGNRFSGYFSNDGSIWTHIADATVAMDNVVLAGLAVTSHRDRKVNPANFSEVSGWFDE